MLRYGCVPHICGGVGPVKRPLLLNIQTSLIIIYNRKLLVFTIGGMANSPLPL